MRAAVIFYSMSGNCRYLAEEISRITGADIIEIKPLKDYPSSGPARFMKGGKDAVTGKEPELAPYEFDAGSYDDIIFVYPVWAGRPAPPIKTFVSRNKEALKGKRISAAASSGGGDSRYLNRLKDMLGIDSFAAELAIADPAAKPSDEKDNAIKRFCDRILEG